MEDPHNDDEIATIRNAIYALNNQGVSTKSISEFSGIAETSIKRFVHSETAKDFGRNETASSLRKFLVVHTRLVAEKLGHSNPELVQKIQELNDDSFRINKKDKFSDPKAISRHDMLVGRAYEFIYEMLSVKQDIIQELAPKLFGGFTCYRPGTISGRLVISSIDFAKQKFSNTLEYSHVAIDRRGEPKSSDGLVVAFGSYMYLLGDIDSGCGIEYIVLTPPRIESSRFLNGLCVTLNHLGDPIMGPVLLERGKCENPRVINLVEFDRPELIADLKLAHVESVKSFSLLDVGR